MNHRTSSKSSNCQKRPTRVFLNCIICGKRFSVNASEYRYKLKQGTQPKNCSQKCGAQARRGVKA